jgi:hypothetical protein
MAKTKEIYVTVRLIVDADSNANEVVQELNYDFSHDAIRETEITDYDVKE